MNENIPTNENQAEKILNEREVLNMFEEITGGDFEISRSLENEDGLYILEVQTKDEAGDIVQYNYIREGKYLEGSSSETVIDVVFFSDGIPVGGHSIKKYKGGVWVEEAV